MRFVIIRNLQKGLRSLITDSLNESWVLYIKLNNRSF